MPRIPGRSPNETTGSATGCQHQRIAENYPQRPFTPPPDATEIVMVRHGASQAAVPDEPFDLVGGHSDPALAPEGVEQAQVVARKLAREDFDALFITTLQRTAQTAAPYVATSGLEPIVIEELREVNLGDWEGGEFRRRVAKADPIVGQIFVQQRWDVIPGAEPAEQFAQRVRAGVARIVEHVGPGSRAVAFLHAAVIAEICHQATESRRLAFSHVDNCSISRLIAFGGGFTLLRSFNDRTHLDDVV